MKYRLYCRNSIVRRYFYCRNIKHKQVSTSLPGTANSSAFLAPCFTFCLNAPYSFYKITYGGINHHEYNDLEQIGNIHALYKEIGQ